MRPAFNFTPQLAPQCSLRADAIDSMLKLTFDPSSSLPPIKSNPIVRLNGRPFKNSGSRDIAEAPKLLFFGIQIWRDTASWECEPYRNSSGRKQTHNTKRTNSSPSIPAKVDDETVYFPQLLDGARKSGVRRIVYAGSSSCYGDQPTPAKNEKLELIRRLKSDWLR